MGRNKGVKTTYYMPEDMEQAVWERIERTGETRSDLIRQGLAHVLGRPDLAAPPPTGRPRKDPAPDQPEAAPRKKVVAAGGKKLTAAKKAARKKATK